MCWNVKYMTPEINTNSWYIQLNYCVVPPSTWEISSGLKLPAIFLRQEIPLPTLRSNPSGFSASWFCLLIEHRWKWVNNYNLSVSNHHHGMHWNTTPLNHCEFSGFSDQGKGHWFRTKYIVPTHLEKWFVGSDYLPKCGSIAFCWKHRSLSKFVNAEHAETIW